MPVLKEYINPNINKFKEILNKEYNDINFDNEKFIDELFNYVYSENIKGIVSFRKKCQEFFKIKRNGKPVSKLTIEYWKSRGFDTEYANKQISEIQLTRSKISKAYWLNKGFSNDEAIEQIKNEQSKRSRKRYEKYTKEEISRQSVWSINHWIDMGLSLDEAVNKVHSLNYSCREFWSSDKEYETIKKIIGKKTSDFIKNNPELYKSFFGSISKEEITFFEDITKQIKDIKHTEFIVNIKKSNDLEQGIIKYDGYYKDGSLLILIEYDGLYWHNQAYDKIKDSICLSLRKDVSGIIRVSSEQYKTNKKIIKIIKDAIKQIKSKECNRVKIY